MRDERRTILGAFTQFGLNRLIHAVNETMWFQAGILNPHITPGGERRELRCGYDALRPGAV
jgi:hypothetical protein